MENGIKKYKKSKEDLNIVHVGYETELSLDETIEFKKKHSHGFST